RQKRAEQGTHHVDKTLAVKQIEEEYHLMCELALFLDTNGFPVYIMDQLDGIPRRILKVSSNTITAPTKIHPKMAQQTLDQMKLKQRLLNRTWSLRGNQELISLFVELLPNALEAQRCNIFINDSSDHNAWLLCGSALGEQQVEVTRKMRSEVQEVMESGKTVFREDLAEGNVDGPHHGFLAQDTICVPIRSLSGNRISGVIQLLNKEDDQSFDTEDQHYLERVALHLQTAIENVFLRQQMIDFSDIYSNSAPQTVRWMRYGLIALSVLLGISVTIHAIQFFQI
ncbi:MAG: GAF domain-containing protein, partial [Magnetococcales bacterium]|nr:GAF domain-containing protein [Magnetococcales bacterium]